jgi:hypothetical protein
MRRSAGALAVRSRLVVIVRQQHFPEGQRQWQPCRPARPLGRQRRHPDGCQAQRINRRLDNRDTLSLLEWPRRAGRKDAGVAVGQHLLATLGVANLAPLDADQFAEFVDDAEDYPSAGAFEPPVAAFIPGPVLPAFQVAHTRGGSNFDGNAAASQVGLARRARDRHGLVPASTPGGRRLR